MKTIIYTPYDCLITYKEKSVHLAVNEHLIFENVDDVLEVYPTGKTKKYSFSINLSSQESSCFYSIVKKEGKTLIFLIDGLILENVDIHSFSYKGKSSSVEISKDKITFVSPLHKKIITLSSTAKILDCGNFKFINYVHFQNNKNKEFLIAYNTLTNKTKLLQGDKFEITQNGFSISNTTNSFYKNIEEKFLVDEDGLKAKEKVFSLKENYDKEINIFRFMNDISIKNYQEAFSFLSPRLQSELSVQHLKNYFGDISYFYCIDPKTCFAISNGKNIIYDFEIENNLIKEINDNI